MSSGTAGGTATTMAHSQDPFRIGKAVGSFFEGAVDEVRVYDKALTVPEVAKVMNGP